MDDQNILHISFISSAISGDGFSIRIRPLKIVKSRGNVSSTMRVTGVLSSSDLNLENKIMTQDQGDALLMHKK